MRVTSIMLALPLLALAACGGAGPESAGSVAAPPAGTGGTGSGGTGSGGSGTGVGAAPTPTPTPSAGFLSVAEETTFTAVGAAHSFDYSSTNGVITSVLYQGNAGTVRSPSGSVAYSPRDGIFTLTLNDTKAGITRTNRFQDPAHRSDFNPESTPSLEAPNLAGFNYLTSGNATQTTTFFYQRPDSTIHVTLGGFSYLAKDAAGVLTERDHGVMVFGALTPQTQIPISGSGTYNGGFIASAVLNPTFDSTSPRTSYMQWITGDSRVLVDFGRSTVAVDLSGRLGPTFSEGTRIADAALLYPSGTYFAASGSATIDLIRTGGFAGVFDTAFLGTRAIDFAGISAGSSTAGASSIDGAFFGPNAVNVGGSFRIVGGVPDQRVDIQGAFTGSR
ncbi:hypothetical protein ASG29_14190 [Sphingomonas sp. Leaf412]|uniref:hypothetical protein n=1 Tax=Sphingomonas sp. Leaf412 TaxID=1736370 RepID=UPI0006FA2F36|nr:hypothetical protein [Sphingomonas sp. Leaf412]KQT32836.1 hypothetical protein ASG29_14190 [Sphingomonas sp. Leaf412]